jgi:predicted phosphodiesterase
MATSNQKTLVVGDMHLKEELILGRVDAAVSQMDIERVVFCGDYTDEWHSNRLTTLDALDMLVAWVRRRRRQGMEIDLVLGNHDMQYLRRAPGPGTHVDLYDEVANALATLGVQVATIAGNCLVTHAGVTRAWADRHLELNDTYDVCDVCQALNAMWGRGGEDDFAALESAGPGRGGFEIPGPLWADQSELYQDPLPGIHQIVGHSPVESIDLWQIPSEDGCHTAAKLVFCDTFGLTRDLTPIGDGSILFVEGKSVEPVTSDSLGLDPWSVASWEWMSTCVLPFL